MKKTFALILVTLMLSACFGCANKAVPAAEPANELEAIKAAGKITIATSPDFAPIEFIDLNKTGQESYVGADVELMKYIAKELGVELVIEAMDFSAVQAAITSNKVDLAISGFAKTEERAASMELSDYYNMEEADTQLVLVPKGQAADYASPENFAGKLVAAQTASLQYNLTEAQLPEAKIEVISNLNDAIMMLTSGKVDAVACSGDVAEGYCTNYPDIEIAQFAFESDSEGNVIAGTKGETALMAAVNEILKKVNDENLYSAWLDDATALAAELGIETN